MLLERIYFDIFLGKQFDCYTRAGRNGVYVNVADKVRDAFKTSEVVRLDCAHVYASDCKKIGVKLRVCILCPRICCSVLLYTQ